MTRTSLFLAGSAIVLVLVLGSGCRCSESVVPSAGDLAAKGDDGSLLHQLSIDLGDVFPGQTASRRIRLVNCGRSSVVVDTCDRIAGDQVALAGAPDREHPFSIAVPGDGVLLPGAEVDAIVRFSHPPEVPFSGPKREYSSVAALKASPSPDPLRLSLSARVLGCPDVSPAGLDFGPTLVGSTSRGTLTIANPASFPIEVGCATAGGPTQFWVEDTSSFTLPAESTREVTLAFLPAAERSYEDVVSFTFGPWCSASASLAGFGVSRLVDWSPITIDYSWVPVGAAVTGRVAFTNNSRDTIRLSGARVLPAAEGTSEGEFSLPGDEWRNGFALEPGNPVIKTVQCAPTTLGPKRARLTFELDSPAQVSGEILLRAGGGGPEIATEPQAIAFGQVALVAGASLSATRTLQVRNVGMSPPDEWLSTALRLGRQGSDGSFGPPYYEVEAEPPMSPDELSLELPPGFEGNNAITAGTSVDLVVRFTPRSAGPKRATLVLFSNDLQHPELRIGMSADALKLPPCEYRVITPSLEYGIVHATSPRTMDFVVENTGRVAGRDCLFSALTLEGHESGFGLDAPFASMLVAPGQKLRIPVTFAPPMLPADDEIPLAGRLRIDASSPSAPSVSGALHGAVGQPCLVFAPGFSNFGTIGPGQRSPELIPQLINLCHESVTLSSIALRAEESGFELRLLNPIPPTGLEVMADCHEVTRVLGHPPETRIFGIRFAPPSSGDFQASVEVEFVRQGKALHHVFPVKGSAEPNRMTEEVFMQGGGDPVDVLLHSGERVTGFPAGYGSICIDANAFVSVLQRAGNDFHLGVVGPRCEPLLSVPNPPPLDDLGALYSVPNTPERFLTRATPDVANKFALKLDPRCPEDHRCFPTNPGIDLQVRRALSPALANGPNAGFRRSNARLSILMVGWGSSLLTLCREDPAQYQEYWPRPFRTGEVFRDFMEAAGPPYVGKLSFAGLHLLRVPEYGCAEDWVYNSVMEESGKAYAQWTNGMTGSFCSSPDEEPDGPCDPRVWIRRTELLAESASGMHLGFPLSSRPDLAREPIEVSVNGAPVPSLDQSGARVWSYEGDDNSVRFTLQAAPPPGSRVVVRYFSVVQ